MLLLVSTSAEIVFSSLLIRFQCVCLTLSFSHFVHFHCHLYLIISPVLIHPLLHSSTWFTHSLSLSLSLSLSVSLSLSSCCWLFLHLLLSHTLTQYSCTASSSPWYNFGHLSYLILSTIDINILCLCVHSCVCVWMWMCLTSLHSTLIYWTTSTTITTVILLLDDLDLNWLVNSECTIKSNQFQQHKLRLVSPENPSNENYTAVVIQMKNLKNTAPAFDRPTYETQIIEEDDRSLPRRVLQVAIYIYIYFFFFFFFFFFFLYLLPLYLHWHLLFFRFILSISAFIAFLFLYLPSFRFCSFSLPLLFFTGDIWHHFFSSSLARLWSFKQLNFIHLLLFFTYTSSSSSSLSLSLTLTSFFFPFELNLNCVFLYVCSLKSNWSRAVSSHFLYSVEKRGPACIHLSPMMDCHSSRLVLLVFYGLSTSSYSQALLPTAELVQFC